AEVGGKSLANALCVAEDADGIGSLVGRDIDESVDAVVAGGPQDVQRAKDIRLDALHWVRLQERKVLQSGGVEHHLRPMPGKYLLKPIGIADVGQHQIGVVEECAAADRQLHGMEGRLVTIEHDEGRRVKADELAAQ